MNLLEKKSTNLLANLFLYLSIFSLLLVTLLITLQVIVRNFFVWSIPDAIIIFENLAVIILLFPLAAIRHHQIRVSFFYRKIVYKNFIHILGYCFSLFIGFILLIASWKNFWSAWQVGSYHEGFLQIPEAPVRLLFHLSILVFFLALLQDLWEKKF